MPWTRRQQRTPAGATTNGASPAAYCSYHSWQDSGGSCFPPEPPSPQPPAAPLPPPRAPPAVQVPHARAPPACHMRRRAGSCPARPAALAAALSAARLQAREGPPPRRCLQAASVSPPPPAGAAQPPPRAAPYQCTQGGRPPDDERAHEQALTISSLGLTAGASMPRAAHAARARSRRRRGPGLRCRGRAVSGGRLRVRLRVGQARRLLQLPQLAGLGGQLLPAGASHAAASSCAAAPAARTAGRAGATRTGATCLPHAPPGRVLPCAASSPRSSAVSGAPAGARRPSTPPLLAGGLRVPATPCRCSTAAAAGGSLPVHARWAAAR